MRRVVESRRPGLELRRGHLTHADRPQFVAKRDLALDFRRQHERRTLDAAVELARKHELALLGFEASGVMPMERNAARYASAENLPSTWNAGT